MNNPKYNITCCYIVCILVCMLQPACLLSQNTATASGNWNDCGTWGNPAAIYRNTTDTKTINGGITVAANENWSTAAIQLNAGSAVNFSGSTVVDFTTDQGDDKNCGCGAYIAPRVWKQFMCHNLGADTSADPFTPSASIHGARYAWGAKTNESGYYWTSAQEQSGSSGAVGFKPDNTWRDDIKTANDPCPSGYRVPTKAQWDAVINNNSRIAVGSWGGVGGVPSVTNFGAAIKFGNSLLLPAAGQGGAAYRGFDGLYWSSTFFSGNYGIAARLNFVPGWAITDGSGRNMTYPVRCIAE